MSYTIIFSDLAEQNIAQAVDYYDALDVNSLADKFINDLHRTIAHLRINPYFQLKTNEYRAIAFDKFPYIILFRVLEDENKVKIVNIFHTSQDPDKYPD